MNSLVPSLIRTYVPLGVGVLLTWLATSLKIVVDPSSQAGLVALCVAIVTAAYYGAARVLERRWPKFGALLGLQAQPTYPAVQAVPTPPAV